MIRKSNSKLLNLAINKSKAFSSLSIVFILSKISVTCASSIPDGSKDVLKTDDKSYPDELMRKCKSSFEKRPIVGADFYYNKRNIVLFVDGEPHIKDFVIKDDEYKRRELRSLGCRVYLYVIRTLRKI